MGRFKYIPEWEKIKERYRAFWECEIVDRCCINITARKDGTEHILPPSLPEAVGDRWTDLDYIKASNLYKLETTFFGGETIPSMNGGFCGVDFVAVHMGCPIELSEETGWFTPIIQDGALTDYPIADYYVREDSPWWQFSKRLHMHSLETAQGLCTAGIQAIGGCGDTLAALRGTKELLTDLIECPDYVRAFDYQMYLQWKYEFEWAYELQKEYNEGTLCGWFSLWSPGKFYPLQNDFSFMISPKMFRDIFMPNIVEQAQYLDHTVYHVDGEGAFSHVDALLEVPKIQCIQILPGPGASPLDYLGLLKRVQGAGHGLCISLNPEDVERALELLSAKGLIIYTQCKSETQARYILDNIGKWTKE